MSSEQLAQAARKWRGNVSAAKAAAQLGIPTRTWEGIEQGRGFRYPQLLLTLFKAVKANYG
jgi:hypothetical protein